ncbi:MAG: hypothetical protein R3B59_02515 [Dehalococcoidia bacterium]
MSLHGERPFGGAFVCVADDGGYDAEVSRGGTGVAVDVMSPRG